MKKSVWPILLFTRKYYLKFFRLQPLYIDRNRQITHSNHQLVNLLVVHYVCLPSPRDLYQKGDLGERSI